MAEMKFRRTRRRNDERLPLGQLVDFVAIDFETANSSRSSICSVGVAAVRDGVIVLDSSVLINPECEFSHYNTAVNGITAEDVRDAPTMPEAWPVLTRLLDGATVCAHSATFDVGALRSSAARYGLAGPNVEVFCTWRIARRVWPEFASHGLGVVASNLGFQFDHHQAGEDAIACAKVALAAQRRSGVASLAELADKLDYRPGVLTASSYEAMNLTGPLHAMAGRQDADPDHPLFGKTVCFTGAMFAMLRAEAAQCITEVGANFKDNMSAAVDYLVIGDADYVAFADGWKTGKLQRAIDLRAEGAPVEIIAERDFLALLWS